MMEDRYNWIFGDSRPVMLQLGEQDLFRTPEATTEIDIYGDIGRMKYGVGQMSNRAYLRAYAAINGVETLVATEFIDFSALKSYGPLFRARSGGGPVKWKITLRGDPNNVAGPESMWSYVASGREPLPPAVQSSHLPPCPTVLLPEKFYTSMAGAGIAVVVNAFVRTLSGSLLTGGPAWLQVWRGDPFNSPEIPTLLTQVKLEDGEPYNIDWRDLHWRAPANDGQYFTLNMGCFVRLSSTPMDWTMSPGTYTVGGEVRRNWEGL